MSAELKVGDPVEWTSQAHGYVSTKRGVIVGSIAAGERPDKYDFPQLHKGVGCGLGRSGESYVVKVGNRLYWPYTKNLRHAIDPAEVLIDALKAIVHRAQCSSFDIGSDVCKIANAALAKVGAL